MLLPIFVFIGSFALSAFPMPFIKQMAFKFGFVDAPAHRKMHTAPVPLLGGVAIFGGALIMLTSWFASRGNWHVLGVLGAACLIAIVGLIDDYKELSPKLKLAGQMVAFLLVTLLGIQVELPVPAWMNWMLTIIWFAVVTNAVNFLDNMDRLCPGVSGVTAAFIMLLGGTQETVQVVTK